MPAPMRRLTIFAKGNVDVHDSLVYMRVNGAIEWNGINSLLAEQHPDWVARVRHESCARWDCAGIPEGEIPKELADWKPDLGTMTLAAQFRSQLFAQPADVIVLSMQAEVTNTLQRHRRDGYAFVDPGPRSDEYKRWKAEQFESVLRNTPEQSMANLEKLLDVIRARSKAKLLVYNMSAYVPGERISSYRGLEDAESLRIREYNMALFDLAKRRHDFTIVDVDQVVARAGAARLKLDFLHYHSDGYRLIAVEVLRLLEDAGTFDEA